MFSCFNFTNESFYHMIVVKGTTHIHKPLGEFV